MTVSEATAMRGMKPMNFNQPIERASGILVPATLEQEPDKGAKPGQRPITFDTDGRRRVVMTRDEQRQIDRAISLLAQHGLASLVMCAARQDGKAPCGEPLKNEGRGTPDAGYGCQCSRVHFIR